MVVSATLILALIFLSSSIASGPSFGSIAQGAIASTSIGSNAAGDTLMAEVGGESAGIRSFRDGRLLMQWDVLAALEAGWLANEHPFLFLLGPHARAWLEVGARLLKRTWSPYVGVGLDGEVSILANPGLAWSALDTINSVDGVGGVVAHGLTRVSAGASFLSERRSILFYLFGQEVFDAPEINTVGNTFTEIGLGARYDVARTVMAHIEGTWGVSPNRADARGFNDQTTHFGASGTFRKIFPNGMWIGASLLLQTDTDHITYGASGTTYDTASPTTFRFTLLYGLPLWRTKR